MPLDPLRTRAAHVVKLWSIAAVHYDAYEFSANRQNTHPRTPRLARSREIPKVRLFGIEARREMSKQAIREEIERLVKEALERKTVSVKQGQTRIEAKCGKCGALNRVLAPPGQVRVQYKCKECGEKQKTL